ncbi:MAG: hypothetical protein J6Y37_15820 [Paludibacteraceae bacterium]|nr:hypothetical protein [Paludibacteraceae bacterium]
MEERIISLISSFLGDWGKQSGEWYSYNCPVCAQEKGVKADGKYNLEVRVDPCSKGGGGFHCWSCETKGRLVKLFKDFAPFETTMEFKRMVSEFRESEKYKLNVINSDMDDGEGDLSSLSLPQDVKPINPSDTYSKDAIDYLAMRGIGLREVRRFNLMYIGNDDSVDYSLRNRIYIPSYDIYGELNYYVGRDYTGRTKIRYKNAPVEKSSIIFNEKLVNWYEPVTIVEGPFDHISVPNSIPLLGKVLKNEDLLYKKLIERSKNNINILLDPDAMSNALSVYRLLDASDLHGKIRFIKCPYGYDAADIYRYTGSKGVMRLLMSARKLTESELDMGISV